jgi:hypothetical protein
MWLHVDYEWLKLSTLKDCLGDIASLKWYTALWYEHRNVRLATSLFVINKNIDIKFSVQI